MSNNASTGLRTELKQGTFISQQQLKFVNLLEKTIPELEDEVQRELDNNEALETDDTSSSAKADLSDTSVPFQTLQNINRSPDDNIIDIPTPDYSPSLAEYLKSQLFEFDLTPQQLEIAEYLVNSLDSNGYLRSSLNEIQDDLAFRHDIYISIDDIQKILDIIRRLDPPGIGAVDLRDCLLLQLDRLPASQIRDVAITIVSRHFDLFKKLKIERLTGLIKDDKIIVKKAFDLIRSLNPKPGAYIGRDIEDTGAVIIPDFIVSRSPYTNELQIEVNNRIPELRISESFREAVDSLKREKKDTSSRKKNSSGEYILARYNSAKEFIELLQRRQRTMMMVITAIVEHQKKYFETENVYDLRPMMLKDIEAATGLDISTISRTTSNKHVATSWGVFPLRFFFSDTVSGNDSANAVTNRKIEAAIRDIIRHEDHQHPLSDEKLSLELHKRGYEISRRTVTKYRERCNIPIGRLRRRTL